MLYVLFGEDDFSLRQALNEIKRSAGDAEAVLSNTTVLDGKQATPEQLRAACETVPFLADKRLVIVEGLLERFETKAKAPRRKTSRPGDKDEPAYKTFADAANSLPDFTELVLIDAAVNQSNPLLQAILNKAKVHAFPALKGVPLEQWIQQRVSGEKGTIATGAVKLLARLVGSDLWTMSHEVEKLLLFAGGRRIEEADVKNIVASAQEASIFSLVDAILEFRTGAAQAMLQQLFQQGMAPAQVLVMLARQARIIFQVKDLREQGRARGEIQVRLGLKQDFVLRKAWEQAERYSPARIRLVYHQLLETDIAIKTGKMDGELALDVLVARLGQSVPAA